MSYEKFGRPPLLASYILPLLSRLLVFAPPIKRVKCAEIFSACLRIPVHLPICDRYCSCTFFPRASPDIRCTSPSTSRVAEFFFLCCRATYPRFRWETWNMYTLRGSDLEKMAYGMGWLHGCPIRRGRCSSTRLGFRETQIATNCCVFYLRYYGPIAGVNR
jgi:hypothetical protein